MRKIGRYTFLKQAFLLCSCAVCTQYCDTSYAASSTVVDGVFFPNKNFSWDKIPTLCIPSNATEIGDEACRGLSITSVACYADSKLQKVGARAFADCKQLERVMLPPTVTSIGAEAFAGCEKLVMIKLPPNLERIGNALRGSSITKIDLSKCKNEQAIWAEIIAAKDLMPGSRVRLLNGTEYLLEQNGWQQQTQTEMEGVMNWCGAYCATNMPSGIGAGRSLSIAPSVAASSPQRTPYQYVAPTMVKIENGGDFQAFQEQLRNSGITDVHISGIREIPTRTFENCRYLNAVVLQDITHIGAWAFYGCEALKTITIPESVQFIDRGIFCGSNIQEIIFTSPRINGVTIKDEAVNDVTGKRGILSRLFVDFNGNNVGAPNGCIVRFPDKTEYTCLNNEWFDNTVVIGPHNAALFLERFTEDTSVTQQVQALRYSGILEDILAHTFEGSENLRYVDLTGVITINERAFANCRNLSEITIPKTIEMLEGGVFCGTPLKKIVFESDYINYVALTEKIAKDREAQDGVVDVEENKRNILDNIFSDTDRQVSVAGDCHAFFPDNTVYRRHGNAWISLTSIADKQTFDYFVDHKEDCKEFLREVVWSSDIAEEIPDGVFGSCPNLFKVVLKDVKKIGENAFAGCKSLEEVVIPESVTSIGTNAFTGCRALMELTIPESVTSIGTDAFVDCWSLLELTIPKSVTSIEPGAFAATGLNVVHLKSQNINGVDFTQPGNGIVYVLNSIFSNSIALGAPKATKGCRVVLADGNEYMFTKCGWRPTTKVTFERQEDIEMFRACCRTHRDTTTKLREVVWDNPGEIPAKLFDRCTKLWKIYFKEGDIKKRALAEYPDLKEITISESVRCCEGAFCGTRLRDIHFESWRSGNGSYDETAAINFLNGVFFDSKTNTVTAPEGCVAHFPLGHVCTCTKAGWESARDMTTLRIDNETDVMWLSAHRKRFPGAANVLREVEWSFAQIPAGIFSGGQNLRTVSLSRGVEDIGERAFANCVSLSELEIPASVHTIGRGAFCGTGINDLKFAASTINGQTLGTNVAATIAFLDDIFSDTDGNVGAEIGCTVHFPHTRYVRYEDTWELRFHVDGRGEIRPDVVFGKNQVEQLSDPQNFVVANNITEIGKGAFDESGIRSVSFEENSRLETIGEYAFRGCEQLTSVELPPTVFVIYPFAFCGCTALQKIVIPKNVKFVCHGAFYGSGIQEIRFLSFPKVYIEDNPEDGVEKHKKHFLTRIFSASETEADLLNDGVRAYFPDGTIYWYVDGEWLSGRHGAPPQQLRVFFPRSPTEPEPIQFQQRSQMPGWPEPAPEQDATPNPPQSLTMKRSETIDWSAFVTPSQTPALKRSSVTFSAFASSQSQTPAKQPSQAPKDASAASPNPPQTSALRRSPGINLSAFVASLQTPDPAKQPSQAPKNAQDTFPSPPQPSADATRCWNDHGVDSVHLNDDFDGAT